MESPVSAQDSEVPPRRLSALYQYHNAPEVAPAHGLEYDDTIYPQSDKFPVIRELPFMHHYTGKHAYNNDNRPPKIIFGMKVRTFLVVAIVMVLVVVGAAVGGAVGGKHLHEPSGSMTYGSAGPASSSASPSATSTHTFSAPTPTYKPLSDCPNSNDTTYTSSYTTTTSSNQTFTKYCSLAPSQSSTRIMNAFVYSFSDCVDVCASYNNLNAANGTTECTVAFYSPTEQRPTNCWIASTGGLVGGSLTSDTGVDAAILMQSP